MTDDEADKAQAWRGMSGATAYHLIDRHADGWEDIDAMMRAWCRAQAAPPAPATPAEIAAYLRDLSRRMLVCGTAMDYYGGLGPMAKHGLEMIGAARLASDWADEIGKEAADARV